MTISRILILSVLFMAVFIGTASAGQHDKIIPSNILEFLENDKTNENEYTMFYTCGHFSRELSKNAKQYDIKLGSAIVGNNPVFKGYDNHIINYIKVNDILYFIEPQTDQIETKVLDKEDIEKAKKKKKSKKSTLRTYKVKNPIPTLKEFLK